jgi:hypothetical protein
MSKFPQMHPKGTKTSWGELIDTVAAPEKLSFPLKNLFHKWLLFRHEWTRMHKSPGPGWKIDLLYYTTMIYSIL